MKNIRAALVAGCLAVSAVVAVVPGGAASTGAAGDPVTIAGIGEATQIKVQYSAVWVHFRPTLDSPAVEIPRAESDLATVCLHLSPRHCEDLFPAAVA